MDELVTSPARERRALGNRGRRLKKRILPASAHATNGERENALPIDQGLPRLLYELAVRLPRNRMFKPCASGSTNRPGRPSASMC
jgi:hypothetical protein